MMTCEQKTILQRPSDLKDHPEVFLEFIKTKECVVPGCDEVLENLLEQDPSLERVITMNDLLQMAKKPCITKNEEEKEQLVPYIKRFLSKNIIDIKYLEEVNGDILIIIVQNHEDFPSHVKNFIDSSENIFEEKPQGPKIYAVEKCSSLEFEEICARKNMKRCHLFELDDGKLEWIKSIGDISDLEKFHVDNYFISEESFLNISKFKTNVILISDKPGKGKSALLKNLKQSFSTKHCTVFLSGTDIKKLFKNKTVTVCDFENFLLNVKFLVSNNFEKHVLKVHLRYHQVIYMWDGLDEISSETLKTVTQLIKILSKNNHSIHFITCGYHLKKILEIELCVLSRSIKEFSDEMQFLYIENKLESVYKKDNFTNVILKIKKCFEYVEPDFLSNPLHLHMLTQLLMHNVEKYAKLLNKILPVTDFYDYFFTEKLKLSCKFNPIDDHKNIFDDVLISEIKEYYQKIALMVLFEESFLIELNINVVSLKTHQQIDQFGFFILDQNNKIQFIHRSFAEYLAATYFVENYKDISFVTNIFDMKYTNLRFFFDMLLAKHSPVHIAVLYKNFDLLTQYEEQINDKDLGGRTILHMLCSWDDDNLHIVKKESLEYLETLDQLLNKSNLNETDQVFSFDALTYAIKSECLLTIAFIENRYKLGYFEKKHYSVCCSTLYYCVLFDYHKFIHLFENVKFVKLKMGNSLLHLAIENFHIRCLKILLSFDQFKKNVNYGQIVTPLFLATSCGSTEMVLLLLSVGAEDKRFLFRKQSIELCRITITKKLTSLHLASSFGIANFVRYLLKNTMDINSNDVENRTSLFLSCENGHYETTKILLESGADVNACNKDGSSPLYIAARLGYGKIVKLLIKFRADCDVVNKAGFTPLSVVCQSGNEEIVDLLIKSNVDVNLADNDGFTPLYKACWKKHEKVAKLLIKFCADVNAANKYGFTPLHVVCQDGNEKLAEILVKSKANVNVFNKHGFTPLYVACQNGHDKAVRLLIKSEADINAVDNDENTCLHAACKNGYTEVSELLIKSGTHINAANKDRNTPLHVACRNGHKKVSELLIKSQANVNASNKNGSTPIYEASRFGHEEIVQILTKSEADVNAANKDDFTPLHVVCRFGHEKIVEKLIQYKADINAVDKDGFTPLHIACENGHKNIVALLVKFCVNVNAANKFGDTALHISCMKEDEEIAELLVKSGADINVGNINTLTPLYAASQKGNENFAKLLLEFKADVNKGNKDGFTPLYIACWNGHKDIVSLLIQHQVDVNFSNANKVTPLHVACRNGYEEIVHLLINNQANINVRNINGFTPLHIACQNGYFKIARLLIKCKANINAVSKDGYTPLSVACQKGHNQVAKLLIESKCDVNAATKDGFTPLQEASLNGHETVVKFLLKSVADVFCLNDNQTSVLHLACRRGFYNIVEFLIEWGAEIDYRDADGTTPLMEACFWGHYDITELLIKRGANVNNVAYYGVSPLGAAYHNNHNAVVDLLIKHGADLKHTDIEYFSTPLYVNCEFGILNNVQSFIKMGADVNKVVYNGWCPIHVACFKGHKQIVQELLQAGAHFQIPTKAGDLPVDLARENGHMDVVYCFHIYEYII